MSKHAWILENLAAYIAGGLNAEEAERLETHVAACPGCALALTEARRADKSLSTLFASARPDAGLEDRLIQGLRTAKAKRFPRLKWYGSIAAAVAAVLFVALLGTQIDALIREDRLADLERVVSSLSQIRMAGMTVPAEDFLLREPQSNSNHLSNLASDAPVAERWMEANAKSAMRQRESLADGTNHKTPEQSLERKAAEFGEKWSFNPAVATKQTDNKPSMPISGNEVTGDNVIRRQIGLYPGQTLTYPGLPFAEKRLAELNKFEPEVRKSGEAEHEHPFPAELEKSLGYSPPAKSLVVKGSSRLHDDLSGSTSTTGRSAGVATADISLPWGTNGKDAGMGGPGQKTDGISANETAEVRRKSQTGALMPADPSKTQLNSAFIGYFHEPQHEKLDYFKPNDVKLGDAYKSVADGEKLKQSNGAPVSASSVSLDFAYAAPKTVPGFMPGPMGITIGERSRNDSIAVASGKDGADPVLQQSQARGDGAQRETKGSKDGPPAPSATQPPNAPVAPRKVIIRSGELEFEVESFDAATAVIALLVNPIPGGFIATTNSEKLPNGKVRGAVVVRVPPEHLDTLVVGLRSNLAKGGELKSQRIGSQDITKQYTDLESRLRAARTMQERLLQIIKTGKGEVKDLLNVEKELAVWGTKIEEMEGELRYFAHQVALSTLTITLTEKDIRAPYGVLDTERINMGIEVEDVEKTQARTLAIVADVKGRITKSELKRMDAGQFNAVVNFEVPADAAGPVRDRLKQLGNVARLDANRVMESEGGTGKPLDGKVTRKDAQFFLSLYNLANVAPREVTNFDVASTDAEAAYKAVLARVQNLGGRIVSSNLNRQNNDQTIGTISFQVKADEADALLAEVKAIGEPLRHQTTENPDSQNTTQSKRGFLLRILAQGAVPARETTVMQLATPDVSAAYRKLQEAIATAKGRMLNAQLNEQSRQNATATLDFEVRREQEPVVRAALASAGDVLSRNVTRVAENEIALDTKIHLQVTLIDAARIPPREATTLGIETADVDAASTLFTSIVRENGGRTAESHAARERNGRVTAKLVYYVPLPAAPEVVDRFKSAGVVRIQEKERNPQVSEGSLAAARIDVTLSNSDLILPSDQSLWPQIRKGLTTSFVGLSWSLTVVIIGILFVLPWLLAIYAGYRAVRWMTGKPRSA